MTTPYLQIEDYLGTLRVNLTSTDGKLVSYTPTPPNLRTRNVSQVEIDGSEQLLADYENVTETITADLEGNESTIRLAVNNLNKLFERARRYRRLKNLLPVYIKFKPDTADTLYRSQILNGRVLWDEAALDWMLPGGQVVTVQVVITRRFYWEADSETEISISIATGAASYATGGKTIRDHEDGTAGHTNGVQIDVGLLGDLPAQPRVELKNNNGSAVTYGQIYLSHEIMFTGTAMTVPLEGESASGITSSQADANSSNGNFGRCTWAGTAETDLATWSLSAGVLAGAGGRFFRFLGRFANTFAYTDLYLRIKLTANSNVIYQSPKVLAKAGYKLQEIVALQLPPYMLGSASLQAVSVTLQATRVAGGSSTVDLDFLHIFALEGWRKFSPINGGLDQNAVLSDDGMADVSFTTLSGGGKLRNFQVIGKPIALLPGDLVQRLRVLWARTDLSMVVDDTMLVKVFYRPRVLTL